MSDREQSQNRATGRIYETPKIEVMDQKEVLTAFQITSAAVSWWA